MPMTALPRPDAPFDAHRDVTSFSFPRPSWAPYVLAAVLIAGTGASVLWVSGHVHPDHALHDVALFVHLACLVVGFGAVLTVDWIALGWVAGQRDFADVLRSASNVNFPIWCGYAGLVLSGVLLQPQLSSQLTQAKLALVLVIGWNGLLAGWLHGRLNARPSRVLLLVAAMSATVSQVAWWGAMVIGFLNGR